MSVIRNHITLIGSIASDHRTTQFENGNKIVRFDISTDKEFRANNGKIKNSKEWHKVFAWGNLANFIERFGEKGKKVAIHGRLITRSYFSPEGVKRTITEVEVKHILGL
ncbi:MAG: single-stranded DNA-binding protein [Crocinitomicaceae bacterium]|nr:single-stranded DNA-binding protein [Crocinitomicaceae bacterium]